MDTQTRRQPHFDSLIRRLTLGALAMALVMVTLVGSSATTPVAHAVGATLTTPTLTELFDNCNPSEFDGTPDWPDVGDVFTISTTLTNDTGAAQAFRVAFRAEHANGGERVDLFFGGPTYMNVGGLPGTTNWDDSYGHIVNTPRITSGGNFPIQANFSILRQHLEMLGIPNNGTGDIIFRVEAWSDDFSTFYSSATASQTVRRRQPNGCPLNEISNASPVMVTANKVQYSLSDTIYIETAFTAEGPDATSWGDGHDITVEVVSLPGLPSGDPEADYAVGTVRKTFVAASYTIHSPTCSGGCPDSQTDEDISTDFFWDEGAQGNETGWVGFAANDPNLPDNVYYLVRVRGDTGGGTASHPIEGPQWTYFELGTGGGVVPVTLSYVKATRRGGDVELAWSTATEVGNVGFNVYEQTPTGARKVNDTLIPVHADSQAFEPQDYTFTVPGNSSGAFYIEDVDITGEPKQHGPFALGRAYGERGALERIPWAAINAEHGAKAEQRLSADLDRVAAQVAAVRGANASRSLGALAYGAQVPDGPPSSGGASLLVGYPSYDVKVDRDGLQRVTYAQLAAAGLDLAGVPVSDIALTNRGVPVAITVSPSGGAFGPGGYVEFNGAALDTLYTHTNVYQLIVDATKALRIGVDSARPKNWAPLASYPQSDSIEQNRNYDAVTSNGDPWYDTRMVVFTSPNSWTFPVAVEGLVAGGQSTIDLEVWGASDLPNVVDHHLVVSLNGTQIGDERFDSFATRSLHLALPAELLVEGNNTLTLTLPGDSGGMFDVIALDSYGATYPRRFRARNDALTFTAAGTVLRVDGLSSSSVVVYRLGTVVGQGGTTSTALLRLSNAAVAPAPGGGYMVTFPGTSYEDTYYVSTAGALTVPALAPSRAAADITSGSAQYLVISHPDFLAGIQPLVEARRAQGLSALVVDVNDIYAQFGGGILDPEAIRAYVGHAVRNMGTQYVVLVGGDTYDYFNYLGAGSISFVPSIYMRTGYVVGTAPVDPKYADVDGDDVPDVAIGRLPARTSAELASLVDKTLVYEGLGARRTAVFAADKDDGSTSFEGISDGFIGLLPADWTVRRAYVQTMGVTAARQELLDGMNAGPAITSYVGHSSFTKWTQSGLFNATDADNLTNAGAPTAVVQWGCWNAYHVLPAYTTLGHKLLLSGDRGAAAVLGASTLTRVVSEQMLGDHLYPRLLGTPVRMGAAVQSAKAALAATDPQLVDVILGWTILGDPALVIGQ